jgi:hypothetical protein
MREYEKGKAARGSGLDFSEQGGRMVATHGLIAPTSNR